MSIRVVDAVFEELPVLRKHTVSGWSISHRTGTLDVQAEWWLSSGRAGLHGAELSAVLAEVSAIRGGKVSLQRGRTLSRAAQLPRSTE